MEYWKIGKKIKEIRKRKGLTQEEVARRAGISRQTLSALENGYIGKTSIASLVRILNQLDCELEIKEKEKIPFFDPSTIE
ncbi:helix-turn-helix domain-containing protein [Desulfurobacterium atlanticum]|uniref:Helix-turn-helix n=1 Tax=Desulfurobacterium atlanticum TaxID=240169 RepID=A0A238YT71_9BACT|nr:helix-turn-helix transcriptional regulator [Desulfurobacterium atlanticum]SNR73864.1 Helix-turn-helix [Desulfurobacterium atlanticum]